MSTSLFEHRLRLTPDTPGVYLMKDSQEKVLYVGKASVLRNRLRSYFVSKETLSTKTRLLMNQVQDFEYIVTDTESEALILENTLIKRYKPRYNARLKDDKTYPYLKIDLQEDFPRVYITRQVSNDGARYFGPFASAGSVRQTMDLIKRLFPYRSCTKTITGIDPRPCLEFYINRCVAPCSGHASKSEYLDVIRQVVMFMEGETETVTAQISSKMEAAAENLEFERAAVLRDQIRSIEKVLEDRDIKVDSGKLVDLDAIALATGEDECWVEVFFIRRGKLVGRDKFLMEGTSEEDPSQVLEQFIKQFYQSAVVIPPTILLQHEIADSVLTSDWLKSRRGSNVRLLVPQRGMNKKIIDVVYANAQEGLVQKRVSWLNDSSVIQQAVHELQEQLSLPQLPQRMECYDISHIQGSNVVGSMVVFQDGKPRTDQYRRFRIKTVEGVDDYASMQEMLRRRFERLSKARKLDAESPSDSWGIVPDLVLIDGGKGHLSAALEVFLQLGLDDVPLASLAKENEWIYVPDSTEPIVLPRHSQSLYLVQRLRDEAHRFAITYHRNLRSKASLKSSIDMVTGIGPKRKRMLLRRFGTIQAIKEADIDDIAAVPGLTRSLAMRLKETL